jgi:hypothetical protein
MKEFFYFHKEQASRALSHLLKLFAVCQKVKYNLYTCFARVHLALVWLGLSRGIVCFPGSTLGQVSLMSLALCMSQIVSFIVMQGQTQLALIAAPHTDTLILSALCQITKP